MGHVGVGGLCMGVVGLETLFDLYDHPPPPPLSHLGCNVMSCNIINMMRLCPFNIPGPLIL